MSINMSNDNVIPKNIPDNADAYYETVASQEEIYLEETEEELRAILITEDSSTYVQRETVYTCNDFEVKRSMTNANDNPRVAESLDEQLVDAAAELITGDADDPPLSEDTVAEMLGVSWISCSCRARRR
jgi:hypothetical protein